MLSVPKGACDAHIHVFGPLSRYPASASAGYIVPDLGPDDFVRVQEAVGVRRAVIVHAVVSGRDGRRTLDALAADPERFRGVLTPPLAPLTDDELDAWHVAGVRGIRFSYTHSAAGGMAIDPRLAARIADRGWHAQVHVEGDQIIELEHTLAAMPGRVVIDHMARIPGAKGVDSAAFASLLRLLARGNVWVKLSAPMRMSDGGPPYPDIGAMAAVLVQHAHERLVWGSDWPHVNFDGAVPAYGALLEMLYHWAPEVAQRRRILVENPCELYGFSMPV